MFNKQSRTSLVLVSSEKNTPPPPKKNPNKLRKCIHYDIRSLNICRYMTEILPIQRETRSNQSFIILMKKIILLGKNTLN